MVMDAPKWFRAFSQAIPWENGRQISVLLICIPLIVVYATKPGKNKTIRAKEVAQLRMSHYKREELSSNP